MSHILSSYELTCQDTTAKTFHKMDRHVREKPFILKRLGFLEEISMTYNVLCKGKSKARLKPKIGNALIMLEEQA